MASNMRLLLRLPPAIRQQVLSAQPLQISCTTSRYGLVNGISSRPFSIAAQLSKQGGKNKTMYRNAQTQAPKPQAKDLPKPQTAPPPAPHSSTSNAPPPSSLPARMAPAHAAAPAPRPSTSDWMSTRFSKQDRVLLYVAPSHRAFIISSYAVGCFLLIGAYTYAQMFIKEPPEDSPLPKVPWFIKAVGGLSTVFVVVFGTVILIAPLKVIKSITAVRTQQNLAMNPRSSLSVPWKLQIEVESVLPFVKSGATIEANPGAVALDRNLPTASQDIQFTSWNIRGAETFTQRYANGSLNLKEGSALSRFNQSLINTWPGIKREVKRMFLRDQMAYVRIDGNGNFKLDMQECHMLDGGRVFDKMVGVDADAKAGSAWRGFLVRVLGDRNASQKKRS
ncbi:hypothetical protein Slin14017_G019880 [Septoria linicola]|nr:hypothetical protein Slin14017_G019880 [Septoria linicola]